MMKCAEKVLTQLTKDYGWQVSYEDMLFILDIVESTIEKAKGGINDHEHNAPRSVNHV